MFAVDPSASYKNITCGYLLTTLFSLLFSASCIAVYIIDYDKTCTISDIMSMQQWLLGCGIAYAILPLFHLTVFSIKTKYGAIHGYYILLINLPFNIAWSFVGAIVLFRDSSHCMNLASWSMTLSGLIYQWITVLSILSYFFNICSFQGAIKNDQ